MAVTAMIGVECILTKVKSTAEQSLPQQTLCHRLIYGV